MTQTLTAIETKFMGRRFRSRLEARWALGFEILKVTWDYEVEGFRIGDAFAYLPDFKIAQFWAEVKPVAFTVEERNKAERIVEHTGKPLVMLDGTLDFRSYEILSWQELDHIGHIVSQQVLLPCDWTHGRFWFEPSPEEIETLRGCPRYGAAVNGCRAARFEFGEEGLS